MRPALRSAPGGVLLPPGVGLPPLALLEKERGRGKEERGVPPPPFLVLFGLGRGGARGPLLPPSLFSLEAHVGPITPRGVPVTSPYSEKHPKLLKPIRCRNVTFQYINIYLSSISRLLVMSVITSGTPNKLRYIKTYKLIMKLSS